MSYPAHLISCLAILTGLFLLPLLWKCALPFLFAALLALCMERPVAFLVSLGLKRQWASGLVLIGALGLVGGGLWLALSRLAYELGQFLLQLPLLCSGLLENSRLQSRIYAFVVAAPVPMQEWLQATLDNLISGGLALPGRLYDYMTSLAAEFAASLPLGLLSLATALLAAYYFSAAWPTLGARLSRRLPEGCPALLAALSRHLKAALLAWLRTQGWLMLITFCELLAGFSLIGVSYALLAALVGALVDALPFFGAGTLLLPWALVAFLQGESPVGLLLLYGVTWLTRTALEPKLMGDQAGVPPLLSLATMYAGFRLLGIWGLLLAPALLFLAVSAYKGTASPDSQ